MIIGIEQHKKLRILGYPMVEQYKHTGSMREVICEDPLPYDERTMILPKLRGDITVPEALDFIREVKGIPCAVDMDYFDGLFYYGKYLSGVEIKNTAQFDNEPEAENALLDAVLEYLIKNKP